VNDTDGADTGAICTTALDAATRVAALAGVCVAPVRDTAACLPAACVPAAALTPCVDADADPLVTELVDVVVTFTPT